MNLVLFYLSTFVVCKFVSPACPPDTIICPGTEEKCGVRCNFIQECPGGEDEEDCGFEGCHHECDGHCVKNERICDGIPDCSDGSDEMHCLACNSTDDFTCLNRECINIILRCNGLEDCDDGSDEKDCETKTTASSTPDSCKLDQFRCGDGQCIKNESRCDSQRDCIDNSDEEGCGLTNISIVWIGVGLLIAFLIVLIFVLVLHKLRGLTTRMQYRI